jgi:hypothetical protein
LSNQHIKLAVAIWITQSDIPSGAKIARGELPPQLRLRIVDSQLGQVSLPARILGGWELNTIWTWRGGFPFSIYSGEDNSLTGVGKDRADFVGTSLSSVQLSSGRSHGAMIQKWFDTSQFATNAMGTFGSSGKNILRGPRFFDADLGLLKDTGSRRRRPCNFGRSSSMHLMM